MRQDVGADVLTSAGNTVVRPELRECANAALQQQLLLFIRAVIALSGILLLRMSPLPAAMLAVPGSCLLHATATMLL